MNSNMCGALLAPLLTVAGTAAAGTILAKQLSSSTVPTADIQTYNPQPDGVEAPTSGPEAPVSTPVLNTQGQSSADDKEKDALNRKVRQNKRGRAMLRIDKTQSTNNSVGAGNGVNVPT